MGTTPYSNLILLDNPVAYLHLDDAVGSTTAADSSGHGYNGTVAGTGWAFGKSSPLIGPTTTASDAGSGYITLPSGANTYGWSALTVECLAYLGVSSASALRIVSQANIGTNAGLQLLFSANKGGLQFGVGNGSTNASAIWNSTLTLNKWYHLVGTWDGVTLRLYVNAAQEATTALSGSVGTTTSVLNIGRDATYGSAILSGGVAHVAIYHQTLTQAQIQGHYNAMKPGVYQVFVGGNWQNSRAGKLDINNTIGQRSTCTFEAWDAGGAQVWQQGDQVQVYDTNGKVKFGGFVENDQVTKPGYAALLYHQATCKDYHYLADKRLAARSYLNMTAGNVVWDLFNNYLYQEGVTATTATIAQGPVLPEVVFNYEQVSKCLDALCQQAGYWWQIDENKVLWFQPYGGVNAPFVLDGTQISQDDQLSLTWGNPNYINRQFVTGAYDKTGYITESQHGDGSKRAFALSYEVSADVPVIAVDGVYQSVAVKGATTGYQWYYAEGDQTLAQDPSQTVLASTDTLTVTYKGRYPVVALSQNNNLITSQQALEGTGTGYVESKYHNAKIKTLSGAFSIAAALLAHYGQSMRQLVWQSKETLVSGLKQGQLITVNLPMFNLSTQMLVQTVEIYDSVDAHNIWYKVTCVGSPYDVTWQTLFQNLANQQEPQDVINLSDGSALAIVTPWTLTLTPSATFSSTKTTCPIIGPSTICGPGLIIC